MLNLFNLNLKILNWKIILQLIPIHQIRSIEYFEVDVSVAGNIWMFS